MSPILVPLFAIVFSLGGIIAIVALSLRFKARKLEHEEILKSLESGQELPSIEVKKKTHYMTDMRNGILWLASGGGIYAFFASGDFDMQRMAGIGFVPLFIGLGLIAIAVFTKTLVEKENNS